ncbi:MAG: WD40 repeat domain-containing protein [Methanoregula sp.]|jgi:WD40 repeat protein|nr:WD40 repeat domain-containing protein [Methanoregula sp.]
MKSCGQFPLISPWLYRLRVGKLARSAAACNVPAVQELAGVFCTAPGPGARARAVQALRALPAPVQADTLCREALVRDSPALLALVQECRYLPDGPAERALWFFSTGAMEELCRLDPEDHRPLLAAGYTGASAPVRARAGNAARTHGTCSTLARALTGTGITDRAGSWSYDEWDIVMTGLTCEKRWEDLWLLTPLAPVPLAITAIAALKDAGWVPPGDDRLLWDSLVATLPDRWTHPGPAGAARAPAGGREAGQVTRFCFSEDGSLFATGCCDGMVTVWRTGSAGMIAELPAGSGSVRFLAIPTGNTCLVSSGDDGTIRCHRLEDRSLLWSREGRAGAAALALSTDNRSVLIGDDSGTLHQMDIRDGRALRATPLHPSPVTCLTPDGPAIACGHADGTVSVVRHEDGDGLAIFAGNHSPVRSLAFSPDGTELLVMYEEGAPVLRDLAGATKRRTFTGNAGRAVCTAAADRWFAFGSSDRMIRIWTWKEAAPAAAIPLYNRHITSCSQAPDGSILAAGFHEGTVRIYRMPEGKLLREYRGHKKTVTSCAIAPDGSRLATVSWDGSTKLWQLPDGGILRTLDAHTGGIAGLAGPDGTLVIPVTRDGVGRLIDAADGTTLRTIDLYTPDVRSAALSADGMYLAITGADSSLRIWNTRDGSLTAAADRLSTSLRCCTFLPDGSALVAGGWDGVVRLFSVPDLTPLRTFTGHTSVVTCCTVSRDGTLLVTGSNDTTVRLFRITGEDTEAYAVLGGLRSEVGAVALSPDGTLLAAGSSDGPVQLWQLPYGTPAVDLPGLPGTVTSLAFTPDGCTLAAGYDSGTCTFFSLPERSLLSTVPAHTGAVTGTAILADIKTLMTSGEDGVCRFHPLPHTPFLVHAGLDAIPAAQEAERLARGSPASAQWSFLSLLLAARFQGEIEICPPLDTAGCYDIQIVG